MLDEVWDYEALVADNHSMRMVHSMMEREFVNEVDFCYEKSK